MKNILKIALVSVELIICCDSSTVGAMHEQVESKDKDNFLLQQLSGINGNEEEIRSQLMGGREGIPCGQNLDYGTLLSYCVQRFAFSEIKRTDVVIFLIAAFEVEPDGDDKDSVKKYLANLAGTIYEKKVADFLALFSTESYWNKLAGIICKEKADDFMAWISNEECRAQLAGIICEEARMAQLARIVCEEKAGDFMSWISNVAHRTKLDGIICEEKAEDFMALIYKVAYWNKLAHIICEEKAGDFMALILQGNYMTNRPIGMLLCSCSRWWTAGIATAIESSWLHDKEYLVKGLYNALIEHAYFSTFRPDYDYADVYNCVGNIWPYLSKKNKLKLFFDLYPVWNESGKTSRFINAYSSTPRDVLYDMVTILCEIPLVQLTTLYYYQNGEDRVKFVRAFEEWLTSCFEKLKNGYNFSAIWPYGGIFENTFRHEYLMIEKIVPIWSSINDEETWNKLKSWDRMIRQQEMTKLGNIASEAAKKLNLSRYFLVNSGYFDFFGLIKYYQFALETRPNEDAAWYIPFLMWMLACAIEKKRSSWAAPDVKV